MTGTADQPQDEWSGLGHLEGRVVKVVADGAVRPDAEVTDGKVTLDLPARSVQIGLGITHVIEPLPPAPTELVAGAGRPYPSHRVDLSAAETSALRLDTGRGKGVPFRRFGGATLDAPLPVFTGDKTVRAFGWRHTGTAPLWRIAQDTPLPFTLLSVSSLISTND
jgi:hypothetical protein